MKVVELYIDPDDEESGVEALSFVKNPATHQQWLVFSDECKGQCKLKSLNYDDFNDAGEEINYFMSNTTGFKIEDIREEEIELTKEGFYTIRSTANQPTPLDRVGNTITRYYYAVDTGAGPSLVPESRTLCRQFIRRDLVYTVKDLELLSQQLTAEDPDARLVFRRRGLPVDLLTYKTGKYCRHIFRKVIWSIPEGADPDEFVSKIPIRSRQALGSRIGEGGSRPQVVNQDGRGGISEWKYYSPIKNSSFSEDYSGAIGLIQGLVVYNTIEALFEGEPECMAISEIELEGLKGYIGVVPSDDYFEGDVKVLNSVKREMMDSYNDYPEAAKDNACRAVRWAEENGWGDCGEATGKRRASQLCNGEMISEETIARMASFKRHQQHKDVPYDEGCGGLMWDAWGGEEGIEWASRKLEQIRNEMKEQFSCVQILIDKGYGEEEARMKCYERYYPQRRNYPDNVLPLSEDEFIYDNPCQEGYIAYGTKIKDGREVPNCIPVNASEDYDNDDREMIEGVIDLILQVEDMEERKNVAEEAIRNFTEEGVKFDLTDFLSRIGLLGQMTFRDDLKYEITTVVMQPNHYIARRDELGQIYYVFFSEESVRNMSQKFFKQDRHKSFNYEHSGLKLEGGYVVESWLVDDPENDKANKMGFKVNKGTWMVTLKWDDKKQFEEYVLNGKTFGISLEGAFLSRPIGLKELNENQAKFYVEEIYKILEEEFGKNK